jgi:hypothetical protein
MALAVGQALVRLIDALGGLIGGPGEARHAQEVRERAIARINYLNGVRDIVRAAVAVDRDDWQAWIDQHEGDSRQALAALLRHLEEQAHALVLAEFDQEGPQNHDGS